MATACIDKFKITWHYLKFGEELDFDESPQRIAQIYILAIDK